MNRSMISLARFQTALGECEIAWSDKGLTKLSLLGDSSSASGAEPGGAHAEVPAWVMDAMRRVALHVGGNPQDLSDVPIDTGGIPPFFRRVYEAARTIRPGQTVSYAELAELAGSPKASRAVGQALAKNPLCIVVPCHRVLAAGGKIGGFSAPGGTDTKTRLLAIER